MVQKIKTLIRFLNDPAISKWFLVRYSLAQALAYSGLGRYISFSTPHYKLFLTKSPVAMVLFGNPHDEREEETWLDTILRPGDVVLDAGANIGTFSLKASVLVGETGKVFAFEAHPATAFILRRNIQRNHKKNIAVVEAALGDTHGFISFSTEAYDDVNHVVENGGGGVKVPMVKLDDIEEVKNITTIRCLKIDVEGYELPLLNGAENTVAKTEYILFEAYAPNCARFGYTLDELFDWFLTRGFLLLDPITRQPIQREHLGHDTIANVLAQRK